MRLNITCTSCYHTQKHFISLIPKPFFFIFYQQLQFSSVINRYAIGLFTRFVVHGNENVHKPDKCCRSQCTDSIFYLSLWSLAKSVLFCCISPILISSVSAWRVKVSVYFRGINVPGGFFFRLLVLWNRISITIMSCGALIKPAHILPPFASHCSPLLSFHAV